MERVPLLVERDPEGDVFLHCGVQQPGLLGSVGHRVPVLTESGGGGGREREGPEIRAAAAAGAEEHAGAWQWFVLCVLLTEFNLP